VAVRSGILLGVCVLDMIEILLAPALLNPTKGYACEAGGNIRGVCTDFRARQSKSVGHEPQWSGIITCRLGGPLLGLNCLESRSLNTSGMFTGLYLGPELHSSCYQECLRNLLDTFLVTGIWRDSTFGQYKF
jgi:hypothetical protein